MVRFLILSFTNKRMALQMGGPASSTTAEIYMQDHKQLQNLQHYILQKFGNDVMMTFIPFTNVRTLKTFSITSTIIIKTLSLLWRMKVTEN